MTYLEASPVQAAALYGMRNPQGAVSTEAMLTDLLRMLEHPAREPVVVIWEKFEHPLAKGLE